MNLGELFRSERKKQDKTLEDVADNTGISKSNISRIERNEINCNWDAIQKISKYLSIPLQVAANQSALDRFGLPVSEPRAFYGSLAPKLQSIGCRLDDDISEGYIWLTTPDGVFEPTMEEIEKLDDDSDNYLRYRIYQLISANPDRFRKK